MLTRTQEKFPKDIEGLTSLRFYAVFYVILFHYHFLFSPAVDLILSKGYLAVDFFFILSGYILTHCYLGALQQATFSYTLYMIQYPFMFIVFETILKHGLGLDENTKIWGYFWAAAPLIMVLIAMAVHKAVEVPCRSWIVSRFSPASSEQKEGPYARENG